MTLIKGDPPEEVKYSKIISNMSSCSTLQEVSEIVKFLEGNTFLFSCVFPSVREHEKNTIMTNEGNMIQQAFFLKRAENKPALL